MPRSWQGEEGNGRKKEDRLIELMEQIAEGQKQIVEGQKQIVEGINNLPDRIVQELFGKETVNWGSLVIQVHMREEGYEMSKIGGDELKEIKELKEKKDGKKIDEVLIFSKGEKRKVFFIEGKHTLNNENFKYAIEQLKWAVETARGKNFKIVKDAEIILVLAVKVKNDAKDLMEYFNEAREKLKEMEGVNGFWFIMDDGEVKKIEQDEQNE